MTLAVPSSPTTCIQSHQFVSRRLSLCRERKLHDQLGIHHDNRLSALLVKTADSQIKLSLHLMNSAMQPTQESVEAANEVSRDTSTSEPKEPPVKVSVLQKFLSVRGRTSESKKSIPTKLSAESLSKAYTKRRHGKKAVAQRAAIREADDIFSESLDAYVPKKREQELLNLHRDEQDVNEDFVAETRALSFEREVLDKVVCDREENRNEFEERLWRLLVKDQEEEVAEEQVEQQ